ncbi:MAG: sigma 54-interacting transcriptional regulator [bacterium]
MNNFNDKDEKENSLHKIWEKAWQDFITDGKINKKILRPIIYESWIRCKDLNINPNIKKNIVYSSEILERRKEENKFFIDNVKPFMENLYEAIKYLGFAISLYDKDACCLEMLCDNAMLNFCQSINLKPGASLSEDIIGTTCVNLSISYNQLISIKGYEYYCKAFHQIRGCASPLHNDKGQTIGILSIMGLKDTSSPLNISQMAKICTDLSDNVFKIKKMSEDFIISNNLLTAILESISNGIIAYDKQGKIKEINSFALNLLEMDKKDSIKKNIDDIIISTPSINTICQKEEESKNKEIKIKTKSDKKIRAFANITNIKDITEENTGQVLIFREIKELGKLVNKIVGSQAKYVFDDILGQNDALIESKKLAAIASTTFSNVLIQGESGTGKELFAQAIHNASSRADFPFVAINCAGIPRELIESELFGYAEGAFTGARKEGAIGKFELAEGGTMLLDEIGDMPIDMQVKLLRVLQNKDFFRIGGNTSITMDVRIISATNKNLLQEIKKGNFREELYYRLNVININIPSLKERNKDIEILANHFIKVLNKRLNKNVKGLDEKVLTLFLNYPWPGNIRELENVIEYTIAITEKEYISIEDLPERLTETISLEKNSVEVENVLDNKINKAEISNQELYEQTLKANNGDINKTAKILGISRATFYRRLEKYNIIPKQYRR